MQVRDNWPENQSGYIPGRGTLIAWTRILDAISKPYIYEFDFKQFFPTVRLKSVEDMLRR
jgi:hypothetical protein